MSIAGLMTSTCTIQRASVAKNSAGEKIDTWANLQTGVACFLEVLSHKEVYEGANGVVVTHRLFLPHGTDVTEWDRITSVANQNGVTLAASALIEGVDKDPGMQQSHMELALKQVKVSG